MTVADILQFVFSLLLVIGMILGVAWLYRRYGHGPMGQTGRTTRRLMLRDVLMIDGRHKIALIAKDNEEHLLVLSPEQHSVIASTPLSSVKSPPKRKPVSRRK